MKILAQQQHVLHSKGQLYRGGRRSLHRTNIVQYALQMPGKHCVWIGSSSQENRRTFSTLLGYLHAQYRNRVLAINFATMQITFDTGSTVQLLSILHPEQLRGRQLDYVALARNIPKASSVYTEHIAPCLRARVNVLACLADTPLDAGQILRGGGSGVDGWQQQK